ncbi:MAG TPA: TlpA disulfide reductase family protein [Alphaproteobacteria bacterium]|nr:TlpA disulfide reductase family protein [Alphaproteobacteria bacterium]
MSTNAKLIAALAVVLVVAAGAAALLWLRPAGFGAAVPAVDVPAAGAPLDHLSAMDPAPDFAAVAPLDPAGKPADMAAYRGKALLVNLWATWCAPCIRELPSLAKLQAELGGDDFAVVTIALDEPDPAKVAPFLAQHAPGLPALIDAQRTVDKVLRMSALPTSLLVDKTGKVRAILTGDAEWNCGAAREAVKAFVADGTVSKAKFEPCG